MAGYMIVVYRRTAEVETMQAYAALALPALRAFGARFLVRSPAHTVTAREYGSAERTVVVEFASKSRAIEAYESAGYKAALRLLDGKVERDVRFVEGYNEG